MSQGDLPWSCVPAASDQAREAGGVMGSSQGPEAASGCRPPRVSVREREVLELLLRGYGADTSAERLDISLETVRRHRKSIYKKLDVSCQADLFALFINSMPYIGEAQGNDPLSVYMN